METIEARRMMDASGMLWAIDSRLSVSFPEDGAQVANHSNALSDHLSHLGETSEWQTAILNGFQTWAQHVQLDVAHVDDDGSALGVPGATSGDQRFGDVRVVAIPMESDLYATSIPTNHFSDGTWAGDILFNSNKSIESLDDLFAIAVHEAGHILGLEHTDSETSPLHAHGIPESTVPDASDVRDLLANYPPRQPDVYETPIEVGTIPQLPIRPGNANAAAYVVADLHSQNDLDQFQIPRAARLMPLELRLITDGISMLDSHFTATDLFGNVLGTSHYDTESGDHVLLIEEMDPEIPTGESHINVEISSDADTPHHVGSYALTAQRIGERNGAVPRQLIFGLARSRSAGIELTNIGLLEEEEPFELGEFVGEELPHETLVSLDRDEVSGFNRFSKVGTIQRLTETDPLLVEVPGTAGSVMSVSLSSLSNGFRGTLEIETVDGDPVDSISVVNNEFASVLQVDGVASGEQYVLRVSTHEESTTELRNPSEDRKNLVEYKVVVQFDGELEEPDVVEQRVLNQETPRQTNTLSVDRTRMFRFGISSMETTETVSLNVRDLDGNVVAELDSNGELTTGSFLLPAGDFEATVSIDESVSTEVGYKLNITSLDEPLGVEPIDSTEDPFAGWEWLDNFVNDVILTGDLNGDGRVDFADFLILSRGFGKQDAEQEDGDINDDKVVDFSDFLLLAQNFGKTDGPIG